ncbi:MAG: hypothetical protein ABR573_11955 [Candidatus Dormibacteria bacterium]
MHTTRNAGARAWVGPAILVPLVALVGCGSAPSKAASTQAHARAVGAPVSSPTTTETTTAALAACDLLTLQDAQTAVGQTLVPDPSNDKATSCNYVSTDNLGYGVSVTPGTWDSLLAEAGDAPHVSGIGDEALNHDGQFLYVRKGTRGFVLNVRDHSTAPEQRLATAKVLALKLVARFR